MFRVVKIYFSQSDVGEIIELFVTTGMKVNIEHKDGHTPLHVAAKNGN